MSKFILLILILNSQLYSQSKQLKEIDITGKKPSLEIKTENDGFQILEGKKNETILLQNTMGNKSTNNVRQILSKIPGLNIWENDGSGIQINISTRGLSPNRSWEFNTRQNGYDMSADIFGYPEAYYNPPLEAVEKIELVRGSGALQYGPQFGGMVNYILKKNKSDKPFNFESQITTGSYGLASLYTAIHGKINNWQYYIYNQMRKSDGWRENGYYDIRNTHGIIQYNFNEAAKLSMEYTNMNDRIQQSGGLTDAAFNSNPSQSFRARNWMGTPWQIANIKYEHKLDSHYKFLISATALWGERNSVGYITPANKFDTINTSKNEYNLRQLDRDYYRNMGIEFRNFLSYKINQTKQDLAFGVKAYKAHTDRNQKGIGTTGSDFDLTELSKYQTALDFNTTNIALFAENTFRIGKKLSISPGLRYEWIQSDISGRLGITNNQDILTPSSTLSRSVLLGGISAQFKLNAANQIYGSATQSYRPILFSDLTPPATTDVIDQNLKDASGWNIDLGLRGQLWDILKYDVSAFYLLYSNRIGTIRQFPNNDPTKTSYQFRTNLGESIHRGIESYIELDLSSWIKKDLGFGHLSLFTSGSYIHASYSDFKVYSVSGTSPNQVISEKNLKGNAVEYVPTWMVNVGINYKYKHLGIQVQSRTTSDIYTDATNTELANPEATVGKINGYTVYDVSAEYKINSQYQLGCGINNLTNEIYATRRSGGYPGPGLLPGEGRGWYFSFGVRI